MENSREIQSIANGTYFYALIYLKFTNTRMNRKLLYKFYERRTFAANTIVWMLVENDLIFFQKVSTKE